MKNTNEMMKEVTDAMKTNGASIDDISKAEIFIQFIGNAAFRNNLQNYVFENTYKA